MLFYSCNNSEERKSNNVKPSEDQYQEDTAFSGQDKPNARYVELKGERELPQDLSNVDVISIFENDTKISLYIGKTKSDIDSFKLGMREQVRYDPFAKKVILENLPFAEICEILSQKCVPSMIIDRKEINESESYYFEYFTGFYVKGQNVGQCYYVYKRNILRYFDELLYALNNSEWKDKYQEVIQFIIEQKARVMKFGK